MKMKYDLVRLIKGETLGKDKKISKLFKKVVV